MCAHPVASYGPIVSNDKRPANEVGVSSSADHTGIPQYEIRVKGHIPQRWTTWLDGLSLVDDSDGTTVIRGELADQAALHGVLAKLRDVGIPLVSIVQVSPESSERN